MQLLYWITMVTGNQIALGLCACVRVELQRMIKIVSLILVLSCTPSLAQTNYSGSFFICPPLESMGAVAASVHSLRPSDIAVVGAMGNSITAGFGILGNIFEIYANPTDYRGLSWSAGMVNGYNFSWVCWCW